MKASLTFSDAVQLAEIFFGLSLPTTLDELKGAFRKAAKLLHSDVGGDDKKFIEMKGVYDALISAAYISGIFSDGGAIERQLVTAEGHLLSDLGLGLGPTKNGRDCRKCQRKGYTEERGTEWKVCEYCDEFGMAPLMVQCRSCAGSGRFTLKNGREVECRDCNGSRFYRHPRRNTFCPKCFGRKTLYAKGERVFYRWCYECNGVGEIEIHNPVLPKGRLVAGG